MYRGIVREVMEIDGFPYTVFQGYIQNLFVNLKGNKSFLLKNEKTINLDGIGDCIKFIEENSAGQIKTAIGSLQDNQKYILLHAYWLWYLPFKSDNLKGLFGEDLIKEIKKEYLEKGNAFPKIGSVPLHIHDDVVWILENVFNKIPGCSDYDEFKKQFIDSKNKEDRVSSKNMLLHIMDPDQFEPIAITNEKKKIVKAFSSLTNATGIDDALKEIRTQLNIGNTSFYDNTIRPFWDTPELSTKVDKDDNLPLDVLLKFKKAIVLYGPPGTSKTFTARELAINIIRSTYVEIIKNKTNKGSLFGDFFKNRDFIYGKYIHRLQLHPNYTYDDFIAGKTITENNGKTKIETQKGYLLNLIDDIEKDLVNNANYKEMPHIVILDEINRVDISRVFGELFTAMEPGYREEGVDLPLTNNGGKPLKLQVPKNLYFIGTMNLIDFSLEQVDFALRRRFAWVERNYDEDKLKKILDNKINDNKIEDIDEETVSNYIKKCSALNEKISEQSNLGPAYQIGHTFFAEVIDIYKELTDQNIVWDSAVEFLWNISIKPMIEAYCGTMDSGAQKNFIEICKNEFCPES